MAYSEPSQTSKMEIFAKIVNCCHFHCSCLTRFWIHLCVIHLIRSSHPEVFLGKSVLRICSRSTGEHTCRSAKLLCNFIEITLWHGCSSVNLLHIFRTAFLKNTSGRLLLNQGYVKCIRFFFDYFYFLDFVYIIIITIIIIIKYFYFWCTSVFEVNVISTFNFPEVTELSFSCSIWVLLEPQWLVIFFILYFNNNLQGCKTQTSWILKLLTCCSRI